MKDGVIRWGIIGCGDVTEVKSGPGFQKAAGSALTAVMRRNRAKAEDYARRHGVPHVHDTAQALIHDPDVDAIYIATPPSTHAELALQAAAARKPCLVEKPMAMNPAECRAMSAAFRDAGVPLWVAYYRRAQERFMQIQDMVGNGQIGRITSAHVELLYPLVTGEATNDWHYDPAIAGAGLIFDVGSHAVDLLDFFCGPIGAVQASATNTGGSYAAEDVTVATFTFLSGLVGTGVFNFNAPFKRDRITLIGSQGELTTPIFSDDDVVVRAADGGTTCYPFIRPAHVHQPLIQTIVNELHGQGRCPSTAESGARASWVLDECVKGFYA